MDADGRILQNPCEKWWVHTIPRRSMWICADLWHHTALPLCGSQVYARVHIRVDCDTIKNCHCVSKVCVESTQSPYGVHIFHTEYTGECKDLGFGCVHLYFLMPTTCSELKKPSPNGWVYGVLPHTPYPLPHLKIENTTIWDMFSGFRWVHLYFSMPTTHSKLKKPSPNGWVLGILPHTPSYPLLHPNKEKMPIWDVFPPSSEKGKHTHMGHFFCVCVFEMEIMSNLEVQHEHGDRNRMRMWREAEHSDRTGVYKKF